MTTEERLARLERENRWMKLGGAVLLLALVAVLFVGARQDKDKPKVLEEVRAKALFIVDDTGKIHASLCIEEDGPVLSLLDKTGLGRASLYLSEEEDGPALSLVDKTGSGRASLYLSEDGSPRLSLNDTNGRARANLGLFGTGAPYLWLCDAYKKAVAALEVSTLSVSGFVNGVPREATKIFRPSLTLIDENGKVIFKAPK